MARDEYGQTWWERNGEVVGWLTTFVLGFVALTALLMWMASSADKHACGVIGRKMDLQLEYSIWTGCMVKIDGKWMPVDALRKVVK